MKLQTEFIVGEEISEEKYYEMLEVLPPQAMVSNAFLVGEPYDHYQGKERFSLYFTKDGKHYSGGLASEDDFKLWLVPKDLNSYEIKQQEKKERLLEMSKKSEEKSSQLYEKGTKALEAIPFGQPILVGHHSEKSDRSYRSKAVGMISKSFEESNKAEYFEKKANNIGNSGISSDDPEAIMKLRVKLAKLEKQQATMIAINKIIKSKKLLVSEKIAKMVNEHKVSEETAQGLLEPDYMGRSGFASYALTNNNATIRATKKRIASLEAMGCRTAKPDVHGDGWTLHENLSENRIQFIFLSIPSADVRGLLKSWGFRWSPRNSAWQRQLNNAGIYASKKVIEALNKQ